MSVQIPTSGNAWVIAPTQGAVKELKQETREIPQIEANEVLVKMKAVSLNYRDVAILHGLYPAPTAMPVIPTSDGAGEVIAVGSKVTEFKVGDMVASLFNQGHQYGQLDPKSFKTGLGGAIDGCLREYIVFPETGIVRAPSHFSFEEAATLSCAAVTAWNCLYGNARPLKAGDSILVQGTGGVSIFALQFAKAAGAFVIATTSSDAKAERLKALGADVVINYKKDPKWGETARKLSPRGEGVDIVVEIAGEATLPQSYQAVKLEGTIGLIGFIGGTNKSGSALEPLTRVCTVRGIAVGSRAQMLDMNAAIEVNQIQPVIDQEIFDFEHTKDAFAYMMAQKHFGKIVIRI